MNTIRNKKGFTIIELVVVIAVIAILAAVLIPTFASLVQKANISVDVQLVRNLNTALATDKATNGKHPTLFDANEALKENGYDITKLDLSDENAQLLWDSKNDVFCYYDGTKPVYMPEIEDGEKPSFETEKHLYFAIYDAIPDTQTFSIYYKGEAINDATVKVGFDAGVSKINVTYEVDNTNSVIIRTYGGNLTVNAPKGDIKHYGAVNQLSVIATDPDHCYHEYGYVGELKELFTAGGASGTDVGKFIAEDAKFHETEQQIKTKTEYKKFEVVKVVYDQHCYGEDSKCLLCDEYDPEHTCTVGEMKTRLSAGENHKDGEEENHYYLDVFCNVCKKLMYSIDIGEKGNTDSKPCDHANKTQKTESATCTKEGMQYSVCNECGAVTDIQTIPALGHDIEVDKAAKAATCTEKGNTEGKHCKRAGCDYAVTSKEIDALGHEYKHGACVRGDDQLQAITIKNDFLAVYSEGKQDTAKPWITNYAPNNEYSLYIDSITFGYKEDYVNAMNGVKLEFDNTPDGIEIVGVFKPNPNKGGYYPEGNGTPSKKQDNREYLMDMYVLSDCPIKYEYVERNTQYSGMFSLYGISYLGMYWAIHPLEFIKLENFDTSETDFTEMFYMCFAKNVDISGFVVKDGANTENMFYSSGIDNVKYPEGWTGPRHDD